MIRNQKKMSNKIKSKQIKTNNLIRNTLYNKRIIIIVKNQYCIIFL